MHRCLTNCARVSGLLSPLTVSPVLAVLLVAACVPNPPPLWPALTGELAANPYVPAVAAGDWPYALSLNDGDFQPARLSAAPAGDSRAGEQLREIGAELADIVRATTGGNRLLQQLRRTASSRSEAYVEVVTRIDDGLQADPDPANPALQRRWRQALSALDRLASDDPALVRLVDQVAADHETATELGDTLRSGIDLSDATEIERTARDRLLRNSDATIAISAAMLAEAEQDLAAKRAYVAAERANLQILRLAIANGESYGVSLANRPGTELSQRVDRPAAPKRGDSPLVVIRFDTDQVRYAQPLYRAVSLALDRRADAVFTVVAVAPDDGEARARESAEAVRQTLVEMGLPAGQLTESSWIDPAATGTEVHLYVR